MYKILVFISLLFIACVQDESQIDAKVQYSFIVQDSTSNQPISEALIRIGYASGDLSTFIYDTAYTSESGRADSKILSAGAQEFRINASKPGYIPLDSIDRIVTLDSNSTFKLKTIVFSMIKITESDSTQTGSNETLP
jgi:hypothetical protein